MNFVDYLFEDSSGLNKDLILGREERLSYGEATRQVNALANYLRQNLGENQNVLLISKNSAFFVVSYLGIMNSGNVCVPLNPAISENSLTFITQAIKPKICFCQQPKGDSLLIIDEAALGQIVNDPKYSNLPQARQFDEHRLAQIIFTSGSTAVPKGVMLSHENLIENTRSILLYLKLTPQDIIEVVLPFYYCYGLSLLHTHIRAGGAMVLNNTFMLIRTVIDDINKYGCTGFSGVPTHFQVLLRQTDLFRRADLPSIRYVTQAGGKLPTVLIKEFTEAFPKVRFFVMYGMTEATARLSYLEPSLVLKRLGSIGKGIPGVQLEVLNESGRQVKPGEPGEIVATGRNVMLGYYNDEEETKKVLKYAKLHTGDLATIDDDGYIFFLAREKDFFKVGGMRVSPKEIEDAILANIPEVVDCSLIAINDEIVGDAIKAYLVLKEGSTLTKDSVQAVCRKKLSSQMVPRYIEFIDKIPMNDTGKKSKVEVTKLAESFVKSQENEREVERLISEKQFIYTDSEKEHILLPMIKEQLSGAINNNSHVRSWLEKAGVEIDKLNSISDVPVLPIQMFKLFDLKTCGHPIHRILLSSSTTGQTPSKVPVCSNTSQLQSKALLAILKDFLPNKRMPYLVLDSPSSNAAASNLTARGAAIRGFSIFAKETLYAFKDDTGRLVLDIPAVTEFLERHRAEDILAVGFTYIIWSEFMKQAAGCSFNNPGLILLHGGGWKKLASQAVSKDIFSAKLAEAFHTDPGNIMDFYGLVEQTGIVFIDCRAGYKHCPNFADIRIRNTYTLEENEKGEPGLIEIISVLPDSYPGMSILTEDIGEICGYDCACGRKGKYFVFRSRVEKSELRGCGDTFRERRS